MELLGERLQSRSFYMNSPKNFPDLVGQHLDAQTAYEADQHGPGQKINEKGQPKKPEHKEQQAAHQG